MTERSRRRLTAVVLALVVVASVASVGVAVAQVETENATEQVETETEPAEDVGANETEPAEDVGANETEPAEDVGANETVGTQEVSFLRVTHASADAPPVDVAVDGETIARNVTLGNASEYVPVSSGEIQVRITANDTAAAVTDETEAVGVNETEAVGQNETAPGAAANETDADGVGLNETEAPAAGGEVLFEGTVTVQARSVTTVAATGEVDGGNETAFSPLLLEENAWEPAQEQAALSVVHAATDAPTVDVVTAENGTVLAENLSFRRASDYATVPAGDYTVEVREATADADGEVLATANVSLEGGTAYTAYAVGEADATAGAAAAATETEPADGVGLNETATPAVNETTPGATGEETTANASIGIALTEDATKTVTLPDQEDVAASNVTVEADAEAEAPASPEATATEAVGLNETETEPADGVGLNETTPGAAANETDADGVGLNETEPAANETTAVAA